jgi:putative ABC transport system ATP-binding protein
MSDDLASPRPVAALDRVTVQYQSRSGDVVNGVDDLSLRLEGGRSVAVVGRSGSGKSTLISVLALMRRASAGRVEVLGRDVAQLNDREIAAFRSSSIGVVFQAFHLDLRQPLWWNVALPWVFGGDTPLGSARRRAEGLLDQVGLTGMGKRRPSELSAGQKQRVAVARAMMNDPLLFIADEPTGNLDEETADDIADLIFGLSRAAGTTVVVVTHDLDVAGRADRVVRLAQGQITASEATR